MCDYPNSLMFSCTGYTPCGGCGCKPCQCGTKSSYEYTKPLLTPPQMPVCHKCGAYPCRCGCPKCGTGGCRCNLSSSAPCMSCGMSACQCHMLKKMKEKYHDYGCDYKYEHCKEQCEHRRDFCKSRPHRHLMMNTQSDVANSEPKSVESQSHESKNYLHYVIKCNKDDKNCQLREMRS